MHQVYINTSTLPLRSQFISDKQGKLDLVGQIITQLGTKVEPGTRTPQTMRRACDPITVYLRQSIVLTPVGYSLLQVTNLPIAQQIPRANRILLPHNITLVTTPVEKVASVEEHYDTLSVRKQVEEWLGMPVPQQHEDILIKGISLKFKPEKIADMVCDVM